MQQVALEYTFASTPVTRVHGSPRQVSATANWELWRTLLPDWNRLACRAIGETVTDRRSSWVRRVPSDRGDVFVKCYAYDGWRDRTSNLGRWTAPWRRSRAAREAAAFAWLRDHGFAAPELVACAEWRTFGFVRLAALLTSALPGRATDAWLSGDDLAPGARDALVAAVVGEITRLHAAGFRDGNLDLRNLIAAPDDDARGGWRVATIDSPKHRIVAAGARADRRTRADWRRLLPQLRAHGVSADRVDELVRAAARSG